MHPNLELLVNRAPGGFLAGGAVPIFAPRHDAERQADHYDRDSQIVDLYTAIAYGARPGVWDLAEPRWGRAGTEGLYRAVASYVLELGCAHPKGAALDIGCGAARTIRDCAPHMAGWQFTAMDYSYRMCVRAHHCLKANESIALATLARKGFFTATLPALPPLDNCQVAQGSALDLPFHDQSFDAVVATLVIDRLSDPAKALAEIARVLKPKGRVVLTSPLNFPNPETWAKLPNRDALLDTIAQSGLTTELACDGLVYREVKDARGNYDDWLVALCIATRPG